MRLIALNGIAATGKDTIIQELLRSKNAQRIINCTTRKPRNGEKEAIDYYFISEEQHQQYIINNQYATYNTVHGRHYGTLRTEFQRSNTNMLVGHFGQNDLVNLITDSQIISDYEVRVIFLVVPYEVWRARMEARLKIGFISPSEMKNRTASAFTELNFIASFYQKHKDTVRILSNIDLARSVEFITEETDESDEDVLIQLIESISKNIC